MSSLALFLFQEDDIISGSQSAETIVVRAIDTHKKYKAKKIKPISVCWIFVADKTVLKHTLWSLSKSG